MKASDVRIQYHPLIRAEANPYEPQWEPYYEARLHAKVSATLAGKERILFLWEQQQGKCPVCGQALTEATEWQVHHLHWRVYGGGDELTNLQLFHLYCHNWIHRIGG